MHENNKIIKEEKKEREKGKKKKERNLIKEVTMRLFQENMMNYKNDPKEDVNDGMTLYYGKRSHYGRLFLNYLCF